MYLRSQEGWYSAHVGQDKTAWSPTPAYILRTVEGVRNNLIKLCSTPKKVGLSLEWENPDLRKLKLYEVEVYEITIQERKLIPSTDFFEE